MRLLLLICFTFFMLTACKKQTYKPYIGSYDCEVHILKDSLGVNVRDTMYQEVVQLSEKDSRNMQFKELEIPYKYIDDNGFYEASHLVIGAIWGRQITFKGDSITYYHYESDNNQYWSATYSGKKM
jgi:hypothetical protein